MNKPSILYIFILLILGSCTKGITTVLPQDKPKLVVFSKTNENEFMQVSVMKSFSTYSNMNTDTFFWSVLPSNLRITINNGTLTDTLDQLDETIFQTHNLKMQASTWYHLNIMDTLTNMVLSAQAYSLAKPKDSVSIHVQHGASDTSILVKVDVENNVQQEEFYAVQVTTGETVSKSYLNTIDTKFILFSTKINDNTNRHQQFTLSKDNFFITSFKDSMSVVVSRISKDYYTFLDVFNKNQGVLVNNFMLYTSAPSNVTNGLGIFSTNSYNVHLFDLKEH